MKDLRSFVTLFCFGASLSFFSEGLKNRGYSDEDIKKILGSNFLRVWKHVIDQIIVNQKG